jgi:hypothetical protein
VSKCARSTYKDSDCDCTSPNIAMNIETKMRRGAYQGADQVFDEELAGLEISHFGAEGTQHHAVLGTIVRFKCI